MKKDKTRKGKIFVISAPSGCGKTTLCEKLMASPVARGMVRSVSATTRPPRRGEGEGRDYFFVSQGEFNQMRRGGELLEWARNFGHYYGTPKRFVRDNIAAGKDILLDIDVKGAMQVKQKCPAGVFIFILPPSMDALRQRLLKRKTDDKREIAKRLAIAKREISYIDKYNYSVVNDRLERALNRLTAIVKLERKKSD